MNRTASRPAYTPEMLRLFIEGRVRNRMYRDGIDRPAALIVVRREIADATGLKARPIISAHSGRPTALIDQVAIWEALGHPAVRSALLPREADHV
jgi:hypothetical protein